MIISFQCKRTGLKNIERDRSFLIVCKCKLVYLRSIQKGSMQNYWLCKRGLTDILNFIELCRVVHKEITDLYWCIKILLRVHMGRGCKKYTPFYVCTCAKVNLHLANVNLNTVHLLAYANAFTWANLHP